MKLSRWTMVIAMTAVLAFMTAGASAKDQQRTKDRKKDKTCQTVGLNDISSQCPTQFADQQRTKDRKKDKSCQSADDMTPASFGDQQRIRARDGSCDGSGSGSGDCDGTQKGKGGKGKGNGGGNGGGNGHRGGN